MNILQSFDQTPYQHTPLNPNYQVLKTSQEKGKNPQTKKPLRIVKRGSKSRNIQKIDTAQSQTSSTFQKTIPLPKLKKTALQQIRAPSNSSTLFTNKSIQSSNFHSLFLDLNQRTGHQIFFKPRNKVDKAHGKSSSKSPPRPPINAKKKVPPQVSKSEFKFKKGNN
jgi:hypothetical protein